MPRSEPTVWDLPFTAPPPLEGEDFVFVDQGGDLGPNPCIKILKEPYKDIVVKYGIIRIVPEEPPRMEYNYAFIDLAGHDKEKLNKNQYFHKLLGDIIVEVQLEALEEWKEKNHENRNDPTEIIDLQ